ncbi:MAG TPA: L-threonylcarbamoyladenylate synthase [Bacteroidales bacterium]|nr:L-threonylcarbamoyladenylate synthase [Bacteroidales bacterium]
MMKKDVDQALSVLYEGGVILYPTDTIWGLGCDATNEKAIEKLYQIKERDTETGMLILVESEGRVERYVEDMPDIAWDLMEVTDKPLTLVYHQARNLPDNLLGSDGSIGIRVTQDPFCQELLKRFKKPIVSTSANRSHQSFPAHFREIDPAIRHAADYVVKHRQDETKKGSPSSIIRVGAGGAVKIIRE